jgi:Ca2+-binding RTX toxin-like protein
VLRLKGSIVDDTASVSMVNGKIRATIKGWAWTDTEKGPAPLYYVNQTKDFDPASVLSISFWGVGGHDAFTNNTSLPSWGSGGEGNDVLIGGSGDDVLRGANGDDRLEGRGGQDSLYGDAGGDTLVGGAGSDYLYAKDGMVGNDWVYGDNGDGSGSYRASDTAVVDPLIVTIGGSLFVAGSDFYTGVEKAQYS